MWIVQEATNVRQKKCLRKQILESVLFYSSILMNGIYLQKEQMHKYVGIIDFYEEMVSVLWIKFP